jgi:hypothetical protein
MPIKRIVVAAAVALAIVLVMNRDRSPIPSSTWPRINTLASFNGELAALAARNEALDAERERLRQEIDLSTELAHRLIARGLTLHEATAQMEPLLRERDGFRLACTITFRVEGTRRGAARYLINRVDQLLEFEPCRRQEVNERLEAEYLALR